MRETLSPHRKPDMPDLVAQSEDSKRTWRKPRPAGRPVTLGRKPGMSEWVAEWDPQISRWHATLEWKNGALTVKRNPEATNQIFFQGNPKDEFALKIGEQFVIGKTSFALEEHSFSNAEPLPDGELTCSAQELSQHRYPDAEDRVAVLSKLPAMIRYSPGESDFDKRVLEVVLSGIPRASGAAVVFTNPRRSGSDVEVQVKAAMQRDGKTPRFTPSRRLVHASVRQRRQATLH